MTTRDLGIGTHAGYLAESFQPVWWLRNPHAQTILCTLRKPRIELAYRRERLETPDGDFLDLDWIDGDPAAPIVLACHGLEGSSRSGYMMRLMYAVRQMGWTGAALNFRGCSGEPNRLLRSYHSGETGDLDWVAGRIAKQHPDRPLYLSGISLGGNVLAKWLGERNGNRPNSVKGACVCSAPFDLELSQRNIDRGFNRIYVWKFLRTLRQKALEKARRFPGAFDAGRVRWCLTLREFDDAFTAPVHGFRDYRDYYTRSSSRPYLASIQTPTLIVHALDDPLIPPSALPRPEEVNREYVQLHYPASGGHVGFYDSVRNVSWLEYQILSWFRFLHER